MTETDKRMLQSIVLFHGHLDTPVPATKKKLREYLTPDILTELEAFHAEARPLTDKEAWTLDGRKELEAHEAVLEETKARVTELSLWIRAQTVRDEAAEEALQPRVGRTDDDYLANLEAMSERLEAQRGWLKERRVVIELPAHLHADAVKKQAAAHRKSADEIRRVRTNLDGTQKRLEAARARGNALQNRINRFLEFLFPDDRGVRLQFGYSERSRPRARKSAAPANSGAPAVTPTA